MNDTSIPHHIAIIPDGNRRWAREKGVSVYEGHKKGMSAFRPIMTMAADRGVQYISMWGLSVDNIKKRNPKEVLDLLRIFHDEFTGLATSEDIHSREVKIQVLGKWRELFPAPLISAIEKAQDVTAHYTKHTMTVLLAYNGTDEVLSAVQQIADKAQRESVQVTPELFKSYLLTRDLPAVDLLIRTAGEPHLSAGFMMWDVADAELYFTEKYWPDFDEKEFDTALEIYAARERRRGK